MLFRIVDTPEVAEPFRNYVFSFNPERDYISLMGPHPMLYINDDDGDLDFAIQSCYVRFEKCETMDEYDFLDRFVAQNISKTMLFIEPCSEERNTPMVYTHENFDGSIGNRSKDFAYRQIFYDVIKAAVEETDSKIFISKETPDGKHTIEGDGLHDTFESISGVLMMFLVRMNV